VADTLRLAAAQLSMAESVEENLGRAEEAVLRAARLGAKVVLLPELFAYRYFPQREDEAWFSWAHPVEGHPYLGRFGDLARRLGLVLPVSFFERAGQAYFNSLALLGPEGLLGVYRKAHIPDGPGYEEKFYFAGGDRGFPCWETPFGRIGTAICWDQWFPEAARCMALQGADLLLYPTAIGSEPEEAGELDTRAMWRLAMLGHAVSNSCYLAAANRVGQEGAAIFYGNSFIADPKGTVLAEASSEAEVIFADLDLAWARRFRAGMGFFRDRRPELYAPLLTLDGRGGSAK
jgi:N-carbamoylputrescine amidase